MFKIDHMNNISLTRGDTAHISIEIAFSNGGIYEFQPGDKLVLTVKNSTSDKDALFSREFDIETSSVTILPENTGRLKFKTYYYDVQLTTAADEVFTVIPPRNFVVMEEVTW